MIQIIQANQVSFNYLESEFNLQFTEDENFFTEWLINLPELSLEEKQRLDQVKRKFLKLNRSSKMGENLVKMVILSPLLDLAGFFDSPYKVISENSIELSVENKDDVIKGKIDVLVIQEQLWVLVIESKRPGIALQEGMNQTLVYMLANPHPNTPSFALLTNGTNFAFLKLIKGEKNQYSMSDEFSLFSRENELYHVLRICKKLGQLIIDN